MGLLPQNRFCNRLYGPNPLSDPRSRRRRVWAGLRTLAAAAILAALAAAPARAVESEALYQAYWAGLPAGQVRLNLHEDGDSYRDEIGMRTEGVARLATRFRASAISQGRLLPGEPLATPSSYDATFDLRKARDRHLDIRFGSRAGALFADRAPGDTSQKPELAEQFRRNVLDPLSALAAIRQGLRDRSRTQFTVPVYDDARRFDVLVKALPKSPEDKGILRVQLTLKPIAGFKGESSDQGDPDDAPRPVDLTFSDDARLMPLSMRVSLYYLPLTIELTQWCTPGTRCGW